MGVSFGDYVAKVRPKREEKVSETFLASIQFYRSNDHSMGKYGVADTSYNGAFGFDKFDKRVCAEGLIGEYEDLKTIMPDEAVISGVKKYLCAYLSIWPPNVAGNLDNAKSKVTLYVQAEDAITKLTNSADIEFVSSDSNIVIINSSTINLALKGGAKPLSIECKGSFDKDVYIDAKVKGEPKTLGRLVIKANAVIYKTTIQPVEVTFGAIENFSIPDIVHNSFIENLVKDFNTKSFNQAYIFGELAPTTKKIALNKSEFVNIGLLTTKEDGKLYLKKDSEADQSTIYYNNKVEERFAASCEKGGLEKKKAEENLLITLKEVLVQFAKEYTFKKDGDTKYTKKQYLNKIAGTAWDKPKVKKAYEDYKTAKIKYGELDGNSIQLNKVGKIHFFYTRDIHAARNPQSKVLAYAGIAGGVAHIFESAILSSDANSVILHEIGHSLSLHHSFDRVDLGSYSVKEIGKRYKDDIEKEIKVLEGDRKTDNIGEIKRLENQKKELQKNIKSNRNDNEVITLSKLALKYSVLQRCVDYKDRISIEQFESTFIKNLNLDNESAIEIEKKSLDIISELKSLSIAEIDLKIIESENKLEQLKEESKTAEEVKILQNANDLSKTQENYMDYYQDSNDKTNLNFERKSYYQWQWKQLQKTGKENNFFMEVK